MKGFVLLISCFLCKPSYEFFLLNQQNSIFRNRSWYNSNFRCKIPKTIDVSLKVMSRLNMNLAPDFFRGKEPPESKLILILSGKDIPPILLRQSVHEWWDSKPVDTKMVPLIPRKTLTGLILIYEFAPLNTINIEVTEDEIQGSKLSVLSKGPSTRGLGLQIEGMIKDMENKILESILSTFSVHLSQKSTDKQDAIATDNQIIDVTESRHAEFQPVLESPLQQKYRNEPSRPFSEEPENKEPQQFDQDVLNMFNNYWEAQKELGIDGVLKEETSKRKDMSGDQSLDELFQIGAAIATQKEVSKKSQSQNQVLSKESEHQIGAISLGRSVEEGLSQFDLILGQELKGGVDIFQGPPKIPLTGVMPSTVDSTSTVEVKILDESVLSEAEKNEIKEVRLKLFVLLKECVAAPDDLFMSIVTQYKDVLLSHFFVAVMKDQLEQITSERERDILARINQYAMNLVKELVILMDAMENQQLELIREICETAMTDMSKLPDKVRSMKFLFNKDFLAYLEYAISQEQQKISASGMDPVREPTDWLQVLVVIQNGVVAELEKDIYKDIELVSYILRMETAEQRKMLLGVFIDDLPYMDVPKFKKVVRNIVDNFSTRTDLDQELLKRVGQLGIDLEEILPDSRVEQIIRPVENAARRQLQDISFLSNAGEMHEQRSVLSLSSETEQSTETDLNTDENDIPMFREGIMEMEMGLPLTNFEDFPELEGS